MSSCSFQTKVNSYLHDPSLETCSVLLTNLLPTVKQKFKMDQTERKVPNTTIGLVQSIEFLMASSAKLSGIPHDGRKPLSIHNARKDAYNRSYSRAFSSLTDVFETLSLGPSFTSTLPSLTPDFIHMTSDYNENSATQASSAMKLIPVLQKLAKRLDSKLPNSVALSVCEYGCATGGSSLEPLNAIKEGCKVSKRPLKAAMNDLPGNDWNVLAQTLKPLDRGKYKSSSNFQKCSFNFQ